MGSNFWKDFYLTILGRRKLLPTCPNLSIHRTILFENIKVMNLNIWLFIEKEQLKLSKNGTSSVSDIWIWFRSRINSLNNTHFPQGMTIQNTPNDGVRIFDYSSLFQYVNHLGLNQKICDDSPKRNNSYLFLHVLISRIFNSIPHMLKDDVRNIHLLLCTKAIHDVL